MKQKRIKLSQRSFLRNSDNYYCDIVSNIFRIVWFGLFLLYWWLGCEETNFRWEQEKRNQRYEMNPISNITNKLSTWCLLAISSGFHGWTEWIKQRKVLTLKQIVFFFFHSTNCHHQLNKHCWQCSIIVVTSSANHTGGQIDLKKDDLTKFNISYSKLREPRYA